MSDLSNQYISSSYKGVLNIGPGSTAANLSTTLQPVTDGNNQSSALSVATDKLAINGTLYITGAIIPQGSGSYDLGTAANPWRHVYASSGSIYLDGNQVLSLAQSGSNLHLVSPPDGQIQMGTNVFLSATQQDLNPGMTFMGTGPETGSAINFAGSKGYISAEHDMYLTSQYGDTNISSIANVTITGVDSGSINFNAALGNINSQTSDGVISSRVFGTGSIVLNASGSGIVIDNTTINIDSTTLQSNASDFIGQSSNQMAISSQDVQLYGGNFQYPGLNLYFSSSIDPNIFAGVGITDGENPNDTFGFAYSTYQNSAKDLKAIFYGPGTGNDSPSSGSHSNVVFMMDTNSSGAVPVQWYRDILLSGSIHQSGTFYADAITFTNSTSIVETTGSYIMTYDVSGAVTYDTYPNVAAALQPYLSGVTGSFGQVELLTNQTLGSASDTVITFNNDEFDPSGWYNNEYFYYQPNIAGIYQISYSVNFEPATGGTGQINVQITKDNGEDINQLAINQHELNLLSNTTLTGTVFAQLDGDLDKVYLTAYSSVGQDVNGGNGTFLNIKLL